MPASPRMSDLEFGLRIVEARRMSILSFCHIFTDRRDAGRKLADSLNNYRGQDVVVYGVPRGGVIVAAEVARSIGAPLDLVITRKVGHPISGEYAIAAVGEDGVAFTNPEELQSIDRQWFNKQVLAQQAEARRRRQAYLQDHGPITVKNKIAIIIDDGLATGLTMFAAIEDVRRRGPRKVIVAVPVAPPETVRRLRLVADEVVVVYSTPDFGSIGSFYSNFDQVDDAAVIAALK
jgi:putative phosphoribosyl transferase